ncbi:hypothetical protein MNBD_GAMMA16-2109 [hydrothermal vent metagenome]|uniref:Lipase n=1 Tax=hydrothermal vent metagenome TaxID=652676 RepID=A0A3B0ZQA4_9ZZZZ
MSKKEEKKVEQTTEAATAPEGESTAQVLLRGLYMVLFAIITRLAEFVIWGAAIIQLVYKLSTKKPNDRITTFGDSLAQYITQIVRFQTFNSDEKPFPFQSWPAPAIKEESSAASATDGTPPTQPQAS